MNYLWIIGGRGQSASANTWCWYFSGCRYKGLVSISGNHLIPDARHCHHFEVRYVRPGNKIFMKIIQMVCCMHNTFHFMRNSTLSVMKDLSKFSSTTWVITIPICTWKKHTNLEPWNDQSYKPPRGFRAYSQEYGNWCSQQVDWAVKNFFLGKNFHPMRRNNWKQN